MAHDNGPERRTEPEKPGLAAQLPVSPPKGLWTLFCAMDAMALFAGLGTLPGLIAAAFAISGSRSILSWFLGCLTPVVYPMIYVTLLRGLRPSARRREAWKSSVKIFLVLYLLLLMGLSTFVMTMDAVKIEPFRPAWLLGSLGLCSMLAVCGVRWAWRRSGPQTPPSRNPLLALAAVVTVGIMATLPLMVAMMPYATATREWSLSNRCRQNLSQLGSALRLYADYKGGQMPLHLEDIAQYGKGSTHDEIVRLCRERRYTYLIAELDMPAAQKIAINIDCLSMHRAPILWDDVPHGSGNMHHVLMATGAVEDMTHEEIQQAVREATEMIRAGRATSLATEPRP